MWKLRRVLSGLESLQGLEMLLDRLRKEGDRTPLFFYAASNAPEHKRETREHGGQGCTSNAQELFETEELTGYLTNMLRDTKRSIYEHVVFDSATERVLSKFTWHESQKKLIKVYERLLA